MNQHKRNNSGFTLIEVAILLFVIGLLAAAFMTMFKLDMKKEIISNQEENFNTIRDALAHSALTGIVNKHGIDNNNNGNYTDPGDVQFTTPGINGDFYYDDTFADNTILNGFSLPCPARLDVDIDSPDAGIPFSDGSPSVNLSSARENDIPNGETIDCDNTTLSLGENNGIYVVEGVGGERVIIGAVPFRALNIKAETTLDAYKNKIFYAVSGNLTTAGSMKGTTPPGQIEVNLNPGIIPAIFDTAQFMLFSAGEDGAGAWSVSGVRPGLACPTTGTQSENCDFINGVTSTAAATFAQSDRIDRTDNTRFDDTLAYTFTDGEEDAFFKSVGGASGTGFGMANKNNGDVILSGGLVANNRLEAQEATFGDITAPLTTMDVIGELKVSMTGTDSDTRSQLPCGTSTEGAIRYNETNMCLEFCDSTGWQPACAPGCVYGGQRVGATFEYNQPSSRTQIVSSGCNQLTQQQQDIFQCDGNNNFIRRDGAWQTISTNSSGCNTEGKERNSYDKDTNGDDRNDAFS